MKKIILVTLGFALLVLGCAPKPITINEPFNPDSQIIESGDNTIEGDGFLRQRGGDVVTCAGEEAYLLKATPFTAEFNQKVFGSEDGGYCSANPMAQNTCNVDIEPEFDTLFSDEHAKATTCNSDGEFTFEDIADGAYYVGTDIIWEAGGYTPEGGGVMERIEVSDGETVDVSLTN